MKGDIRLPGLEKWVNHILETDVLVVGGGSAGCFAAVKAREQGVRVMLVDKGHVGRSGCSPFAAGAINVCLPGDNRQEWLEEIITRGEYLNDQEWVRVQLEEAYPLVCELQGWGKAYGKKILDEDEAGRLVRRKARGNIKTLTCIINALPMMDTLRRKVRESGAEMLERIMATHLIMAGGRVAGVLGMGTRTAEIYLFRARAVILSAGGCGFKAYFIGHQNLTGEAQYMAYRAGAALRNLDQAMSNTTARDFDVHGLSLMVGSGGRFLNRAGEEFMYRYEPELGSRARLTKLVIGMAMEVAAGNGPLYLDLSPVGGEDREMLRRIVPEAFLSFDRMGLDPFRQPVQWMPAFEGTLVHGGGVHIDINCASTVPGLYSAGDTTCTPEHGTWSITGLNLAFCFVSGARAGRHAALEALKSEIAGDEPSIVDQVREAAGELLAPVARGPGIDADRIAADLLANLVPYRVAYLRHAVILEEAINQVERIRDQDLPRVWARDPHTLVKAFEVRSMVALAEMVLRSVLFRQESRGFVYREDFPSTDNVNWLKWIVVSRKGEAMQVTPGEFATPYVQAPPEIYPPR